MKRDREPETARVVVAQARFARGRTPDVAYGIELVNESYEFDAIDVAVRWCLLDPDGRRR